MSQRAVRLQQLLDDANRWWEPHREKAFLYNLDVDWLNQWYSRIESIFDSLDEPRRGRLLAKWRELESQAGFWSDKLRPTGDVFRDRRKLVADAIEQLLADGPVREPASSQGEAPWSLQQWPASITINVQANATAIATAGSDQLDAVLTSLVEALRSHPVGWKAGEQEARDWAGALQTATSSSPSAPADRPFVRTGVMRLGQLTEEFAKGAANRAGQDAWKTVAGALRLLLLGS